MTSNNQHSFRRQDDDSARRRLLADPTASEIIRLQLDELKRRPSARWVKDFLRVAYSFLLVAVYQKIGPVGCKAFRRRIPGPMARVIRPIGALTSHLGAVTLSTGVTLGLCVGLGILSPISTRSGSEDQDVRLGTLLLPPGQEDTLSDDDGWETPDSTRFPEPPPSDFGEILLPSTVSYTFEPSRGFLGENLEESLSYLEQFSARTEQPRQEPELPALPTVKDESKPDKTPASRQSSQAASIAAPKSDSDSTQEDSGKTTVARHIVSSGENLWQICRDYGMKMDDVIAYNKLSNPSYLPLGLELILPGARASSHSAPLRFPLNQVRISSGYGMRVHPILRKRLFHHGIDLRAKRGTPVYAAAAGKVIFTRRNGSMGRTMLIDHENGMKTVYAHLQSYLAKAGDRVSAGQAIGKSGATGRVNAPHLHFEVWKNGHHVNPLTALPPRPR